MDSEQGSFRGLSSERLTEELIIHVVKRQFEDSEDQQPERRVMQRRSYPRPDHQASVWMNMVLKEALLTDPSIHEASKFRRRFRLPFPFYKKLVEECKRERWFGRLDSRDTVGRSSIPVELKLLTVLQILGRGKCFNDIEMEGTVQACCHMFCKNFAQGMYKTWISAPEEDLKEVAATYARLRFPVEVPDYPPEVCTYWD
ncbi:unnamed protein product [Discosporangium mesarthrocarpum]